MESKSEYLPVIPFGDIALALSGGGFRAASYSLGCISYLQRVVYDGQPLLKRVKFISSASGGSITNLSYTLKTAQIGENAFQKFFQELYDFMEGSEAISDAFAMLNNDPRWSLRPNKGRNLINAFAMAYDQRLFNGAQFKDLINSNVHEICVNATEFSFGISFRFQTAGKFGNSEIAISRNAADEFKLGDILAASSCFPMGFEPIMMPLDFTHADLPVKEIQEATTKELEFGLMDGGVTDNEGIYSFLLAEDRKFGKDKRGYDLFMYCDVASPYMDPYDLPKEKKSFLKNRSIQFYINLLKTTPFVFLSCLGVAKWWAHPWWLIVIATIAGILSVAYITCLILFTKEKIRAKKEKSTWTLTLLRYVNGILFTRTSAIIQMIAARIESAGILVGDVYLKQIRRLTIKSLYENGKSGQKWRTHAIANLVYEFSSRNMERSSDYKVNDEGKLIELTPSAKITACADLAREMDTTLWFDKYHMHDGRREALIAAGQFTTCFNLIEYINRLEKVNLITPAHKALQKRLLADWQKFNDNPFLLATPKDFADTNNKW